MFLVFMAFFLYICILLGAGQLGQKGLRYLLPAVYFLKARGMEGLSFSASGEWKQVPLGTLNFKFMLGGS